MSRDTSPCSQISHALVDETPWEGTQSRTSLYKNKGGLIYYKTEKFKAPGSVRCRCQHPNDFRNKHPFNSSSCVQTGFP